MARGGRQGTGRALRPDQRGWALTSSAGGIADELRRAGVIAVLRAPSPETAYDAVMTLADGGITGIEVTYSTPGAAAVIERLQAAGRPELLIGAGTILSAGQAAEAAGAGASFLVSPGYDPEVAAAMRAAGTAVFFGALTPSEVMRAWQGGADVVKLFPASLGGPAYLRSIRGPLPHVPLLPTGGVDPASLGAWLAAGAVAVGAGSELCPAALMAAGDWPEIKRRAGAFAAAFRAAQEVAA